MDEKIAEDDGVLNALPDNYYYIVISSWSDSGDADWTVTHSLFNSLEAAKLQVGYLGNVERVRFIKVHKGKIR